MTHISARAGSVGARGSLAEEPRAMLDSPHMSASQAKSIVSPLSALRLGSLALLLRR
jgi:hypothetical protein